MALQGWKREKGSSEYDTRLKEIRGQLADQLKTLEAQVEFRAQCLQDMSEFFRRKAEIELEYSRGLEKLTERFSSKLRNAKDYQGLRKEQNVLSPVNCWYQILSQTRQQSRQHGALHEIFANHLTVQLAHIGEDVTRIARKSKDIGLHIQEELLKVIDELQIAMKTYHMYHLKCVEAESKLREIEKLEEKQAGKAGELGTGQLGVESKSPKRSGNRKLEKMKEKVRDLKTTSAVYPELHTRFQNLQGSLATARLETEEMNKTLRATLEALQSQGLAEELNISEAFQRSQSTESVKLAGVEPSSKANLSRRRATQQETETYYVTKLKDSVAGDARITKLQAKYELLRAAIDKGIVDDDSTFRFQATLGRSQRQKRSRPCSQYNQKLFNGDLQMFIQSSGQPIPLVVISCIQFINLHGLHHEGIFRIPGSQSEVNDIKTAFERGEDPLDSLDAHNIDSVAGLLKLYFRSLSRPIFPIETFGYLIACVETEDLLERANRIKEVVGTLDPSIIIVLRYLFAFLNHLSQFNDENMMDAYNLAVCFGPTLVTVPQDQDPVSCQAHVNEVVKTIIVHQDLIFPQHDQLQGPAYEKCMTGKGDYSDSLQTGPIVEEPEFISELHACDDEVQAVAKFDYTPRSTKELPLKKGEAVLLYERVSDDWWSGQVKGAKGLVPHKYIEVADGADGNLEALFDTGQELTPSEEVTECHRLWSDSDYDPVLRKRSGSSPIRKITTLFNESSKSNAGSLPWGQRLLPVWTLTQDESKPAPKVVLHERRNTLDSLQTTHSPAASHQAVCKVDRQFSEKPVSEVNKEVIKNMDSVFRELLQHKRAKSTSDTSAEAGARLPARWGSRDVTEKPAVKQGPPSRSGVKARAAALFKPGGGAATEGTAK
ncbi:SLIT-ROBO Rho GTPase-activating protein 3-like isoform X3 [Narcine bancroftii]|uniref:SLIT-ROBO Rho GTPase-activating protein 3-like isoform X3 n=1 Tax=Narcine bancroftii TaxID=1343680 RepID=UPI003831571F